MTVGFDVFDRWFWCFWQVVLMVLTAGFDVLTVGFDVLMILTVGFDGFDVLTAGFDVFDDFDSRFLCFWWYRQKVFVLKAVF